MAQFVPSPITLLLAGRAVGKPLRRDSSFTRVHSGVYAPKAEWEALPPWDRYLARVHAVRLVRPGSVFCLESSASLRGLPIFGEPRYVHVLNKWPQSHSTSSAGLAFHTFADHRAITVREEGAAVDIADTVLDLARVLPPAFAIAVMDAALRAAAPGVTTSALLERARTQSWKRGIRQLEWVLAEANPLAESVAESVGRIVLLWLGFPRPELQIEFHYEGVTDRVDFYWRARRLIGESDGYGKYHTGDIKKSENRLVAEKQREDRLRRNEGGFARWDFSDDLHPERLDRKLRDAGLQPIRPQDARMLATLSHNPRSFPPPSGRDLRAGSTETMDAASRLRSLTVVSA
ncbi:hypothetical protein GCM10028798_13960 [Humibacter antri]